MIGLGGAEFRLPLLIGLFGFVALSAVIVNKAISLVVVFTALPARLAAVSFADLGTHWAVAANLLGAWAGASWAVRMRTATLYTVLTALMAPLCCSSTSPPWVHRLCPVRRGRSPGSRPGSASAWWPPSWAWPAVNC
ncbi:hypothetical protein [Streptosporangium saharense]|uniref:hypothetical protein n=1 Tax=Streptosporangium saharense TaxID=1706840 RepID=UPI003324EBE8